MLHVSNKPIVPDLMAIHKKGAHLTEEDEFYYLGQHLNMPGLLEEYSGYYEMSNFEIANRAFYATIKKFTKHNNSFLINWHLHNIYSKSQQTLLGINPVKPSVILSGDDYMFTPAFNSSDYERSDDIWDNKEESGFHNLIPCPDSNHAGRYTVNNDDHHMMSTSLPPFFLLNESAETRHKYGDDGYSSFDEYLLKTDMNTNTWIENDCRLMNLNNYDSAALTTATNITSLTPSVRTSNSLLSIVESQEEDNGTLELYEEPCSDSSDEHQIQSYCSTSSNSSTYSNSHISQNDHQQQISIENDGNGTMNEVPEILPLFDTTPYLLNDELNSKHQDVVQIIHPITHMTRSTSFLSQKSMRDDLSVTSVLSYQSLADIISQNNMHTHNHGNNSKPVHSYGSIDMYTSEEEGEGMSPVITFSNSSFFSSKHGYETFWTRFCSVFIALWQFIVGCLASIGLVFNVTSNATQPLLP
ncbi:hypothetical protein BDB01DRAFT_771168 [Pilobolus umbonatus]|nr:hypothetical protein BDB01DRAFT_771168 [Pilobolus umbonatus]